ncbi:MAG: septum formation protein Maf [Erysipelotrichaceae bacterium]|nr:septum formation protein Maf [Erysipelotrichaceae bacterium]MBQ1523291.1 septum formation protein Maf [Erysipelotrichaceae bacterium]
MKKIILASASPRRKEIMEMLGVDFDVVVSNIDETMDESLSIEERIMEIARKKALDVLNSNPECLVIGSDTIVEVDGRILGKPHNEAEAEGMIHLISNRSHRVVTALAVVSKDEEYVDCDVAHVHFIDIPEKEIKEYVLTDEPYDKAGRYAIQGWAGVYISRIEGSFYTVMGLPLHLVYQRLFELGYKRKKAKSIDG